MLKVANDRDIQNLSEKYIHAIERDMFYIEMTLESSSLDITTNRNDLINQLEHSIFNMKELYKHLIDIEDLDIEELENDIEIPFVFNCCDCGTQLPFDNFSQSICKHCEEDRYKESLHMN